MALKAGKNGRLYIAGYDFSLDVNKFSPSLKREMADVTVMGSTGKKRFPLLLDDSFSFDAFYNNATGRVTPRMDAHRSASGLCCLCFGAGQDSVIGATTVKNKAIAGSGAWQDDYTLDMPVADMLKLSGAFKFYDHATLGFVLYPKTTLTVNGNGSGSDDNGAASSAGYEAYLHVFGCGGTDALVVSIQHDSAADFSTAATLVTFTTANGITSEKKSATGSVSRYLRAKWVADSYTSVSIAVIFCRL